MGDFILSSFYVFPCPNVVIPVAQCTRDKVPSALSNRVLFFTLLLFVGAERKTFGLPDSLPLLLVNSRKQKKTVEKI